MVAPLAHLVCLMTLAADPRPLPAVVTDLGSSDFAVREAASRELLASKAYPLAGVERALKDAALTPEQRLRLEAAAFRAFCDSPRGALGVSFDGSSKPTVANVTPGFPSAAVLKSGDVIASIDGNTVSAARSDASSNVRTLIISHDPGDRAMLTVERGGVQLTLVVELGDFDSLRSNRIMPEELQAAWKHRLKQTAGLTDPRPIDATALRPRPGTPMFRDQPIDLVEMATTARAANGDAPSVTAGAAPNQAQQLRFADQAGGGGFRNDGFQQFRNNGWAGGGVVGVGNLNDPRELAQLSDNQLIAIRQELSRWLQTYEMILGEPRGIGRGDRKEITQRRDQTDRQLTAVISEISKRKAARRDAQLEPAQAPAVADVPAEPDAKPDQQADKPR